MSVLLLFATVAAVSKPLDAEVRWTQFGVPHVKAQDFESLGYGYGFAIAGDRLCLLADRLITLRGERSRWYGADGKARVAFMSTSNLNSDLFHRVQLANDQVATATRMLTRQTRALAEGYALGFNRYVEEIPAQARASACHGAPLPEMEGADVVRMMLSIGTLWKSFRLAPFATASAWGSPPASAPPVALMNSPPSSIGSNAWAYGADVTRNNSAIVLANPHSSWQSEWLSMHELHLTIPGRIDVAGGTFVGLPLPVVGFNANVAWSIEAPLTVTYFVMHRMNILAGEHPAYIVDGQPHPLSIVPVVIDVKQSDGSIAPRAFGIPYSSLGPLYQLPAKPDQPAGWYAVTDAGEDNALGLDQLLGIAQSRTIRQFRDATVRYRGLGSHLIAGDRHGDVAYVEAGPLLDIDDAALAACAVPGAEFNIMDGSRAACNMRTPAGAPRLAPAAKIPVLLTRGIIQNTNNSYRFSVLGVRAGGYSKLLGGSEEPDLRLQMSERRMREIAADGRVTPEEALAVVFDDRNYAAETWLDSILSACRMPGWNAQRDAACATLKQWDRTQSAASRGALLFQLLWPRIAEIPDLLPPLAPEQPFAPRAMILTSATRTAITDALDSSVAELRALGLAGDEPWGSILSARDPTGKVSLHGGSGKDGVLNVLEGTALGGNGYAAISAGTAYVQRVQWRKGRVVADVVLAHGQSLDSASPHYRDQLRLFAEKRLVRMPFREEEITADPAYRIIHLRTER